MKQMRQTKNQYFINPNHYYIQQKNNNLKDKDYDLVTLPISQQSICYQSDFMAILFVFDEIQVTIGSKGIRAFSGDFFLIREGCSFQITKSSEENELFILQLKEKFFNEQLMISLASWPILYDFIRLKQPHNEYLYFNCKDYKEMKTYTQVLLQEAMKQTETTRENMTHAFLLFLSYLHNGHHKHLIISESSMMTQYTIGEMLKYMSDHCGSITLEQAARHFNFHPCYFSTLFKTLSGYNFTVKLLQLRLEQASRLLITTQLSMQEICDHIGLKDKSYFHKRFKVAYGMTPGAYRKLYGKRTFQ